MHDPIKLQGFWYLSSLLMIAWLFLEEILSFCIFRTFVRTCTNVRVIKPIYVTHAYARNIKPRKLYQNPLIWNIASRMWGEGSLIAYIKSTKNHFAKTPWPII
jgi:hypothetical protein